MNLSKYKLPLEALPKKAKKIIQQKVIESEFIDSNDCSVLIQEAIDDGIYKNREQSYLVKCTTDMIDVAPEMIVWWFSWHLPHSGDAQVQSAASCHEKDAPRDAAWPQGSRRHVGRARRRVRQSALPAGAWPLR